ncbi:hypothetical protein ABZ816_04825 [Actinosynnema sp. NPDC047251]|uniref:hypothetical protein n=1 Tax=Saccharothrix espanaensis TaxID=103731 RepID=UPI000317D827|nr:hypothetical protein [Saccharothrix espanaensis]
MAAALSEPVAVVDSPVLDRCVRFLGQPLPTGTYAAAEVVASSSIDRVDPVGVPLSPDDPVETLRFLRPPRAWTGSTPPASTARPSTTTVRCLQRCGKTSTSTAAV